MRPVRRFHPFAPLRPLLQALGCTLWLFFILAAGVLIIAMAQDAPGLAHPQARFWSLLRGFSLQAVAATFYFRRVPGWSRWLAVGITGAALVACALLGWKVWF